MTIQHAIESAIAGGWKMKGVRKDSLSHINAAIIVLQPAFWQAVGKVEGWESQHQGYWEPKIPMHRMIDALAEGKSISEFLETL